MVDSLSSHSQNELSVKTLRTSDFMHNFKYITDTIVETINRPKTSFHANRTTATIFQQITKKM